MAIQYVSGKPGGGKSLYATKLIVDELISTSRTVVTNVPLRLDDLQFYLDGLGHNVNVLHRVRILTEDETYHFWRHRGIGFDLPAQPMISKGGEDRPDPNFDDNFSTPDVIANGSCFFVIDEIHLFFNSRQWKDTGRWAIRYLSQHRHLGDDVICVTQSVSNVDKQFRSLMQDITYLRNFRVEKWSIFAAPNKFQAKTYLEMQSDSKTGTPVQVKDFSLDVKGLASCYNTTGGVGMPGIKTADVGKRARGIPIWMLVVFLLAGVALFGFALFRGTRYFTHKVGGIVVDAKSSEQISEKSQSQKPQLNVSGFPSLPGFSQTQKPEVSYFVSITRDRAGIVVVLDDGVVLRNDRVKSYTADTVLDTDGVYHYRKQITATQGDTTYSDYDQQIQTPSKSAVALKNQK